MSNPFQGLPPNLTPNPPADIPEAPEAGNAAEYMSAFSEPQDVDAVIANLTLDRPLKLYIPDQHLYPNDDFRIINSMASEIGDAHNKGFKEVTNPKLANLFRDLVAGTDKDGRAYRPLLMARPKAVVKYILDRYRRQLSSLNAGMDPKNKEFTSKYTENAQTESKGQFTGAGFRIRT
jgi:hypothetical protein